MGVLTLIETVIVAPVSKGFGLRITTKRTYHGDDRFV